MASSSHRVVELIRSKIRASQRQGAVEQPGSFTPLQLASNSVIFVPLQLPSNSEINVVDCGKSLYSLSDLLSLYDRQFVQNAYLVFLKRDPDGDGMSDRLQRLREGSLSRVELLFRLRFGPEGKIYSVKVKGLFKAFVVERLSRVPVLGYFVRLFRGILYLPYIQRDKEELRGLIAMLKNDSDGRIETIVEFQNAQFSRLLQISNDKEIQ